MSWEDRPGGEAGQLNAAEGYRRILDVIRTTLETNDAAAVDTPDGTRLYAAVLSPLSEYGAKEGDDNLVFTVEETPLDEDDPDGHKSYVLTLYHLAEDRTPTRESEWNEYRTDFTDEQLADYDSDGAEEWQTVLETASHMGWFREWEAWFRVDDEAANVAEIDAESLMKRAMKRWRAAERRNRRRQEG